MKKALLSLFIVLCVPAVMSAQQKKDMYISGNFTIEGGNTSSTSGNTVTKTPGTLSFGIAPQFGYFVIDRLEVNLSLGYSLDRYANGQDSEGNNLFRRTNVFEIVPGVRYYLPLGEKFWYTPGFDLSVDNVIVICVLYYISNVHYPCYAYRTTAGLFVFGKYVPLVAAIINIILDIVLGKNFGLTGILLASIIARTLTYEIIDPLIIYKRVFNENVIKYYIAYILYGLLIVGDCVVCQCVVALISISGLLGFIIKAFVMTLVFNAVFFLFTFKTTEFSELLKRVKSLMNKKKSNA